LNSGGTKKPTKTNSSVLRGKTRKAKPGRQAQKKKKKVTHSFARQMLFQQKESKRREDDLQAITAERFKLPSARSQFAAT